MIKKLLFLSCFLYMITSLNAQTVLQPGDIAIIGVNNDSSPYEMAIVNLVPTYITNNLMNYLSLNSLHSNSLKA